MLVGIVTVVGAMEPLGDVTRVASWVTGVVAMLTDNVSLSW